ncbi:MAG: class I SAM-dependent methyltransferase [bacterium]
MTKELRKALEIIIGQIKTPKRVLEVGSRAAINQEELCNLRPLLPNSEYIGLDMQKGIGVDIVADATKLPFAANSFDLLLCSETLEHCSEPWKVVAEMERVSKKNSGIVLTSQQSFPLHLHPADYFRFTPYGLASLIRNKKNVVMMGISPPFDKEVELNPKHVVVIAWNGRVWDEKQLKIAIKKNQALISGHKPYRHRAQDAWKMFKRALSELQYHQTIKFFR